MTVDRPSNSMNISPSVTCWCLAVFVLAPGVTWCQGPAIPAAEAGLRRFESTQPEMGVPFKIILYAPDDATANRASQAAFSRIPALNQVLSDYDSASELSRLSRTAPSAVPVP